VTHADLSALPRRVTLGTRSSSTVEATPMSITPASVSRGEFAPGRRLAHADGEARRVALGLLSRTGWHDARQLELIAPSHMAKAHRVRHRICGNLSNQRVWAVSRTVSPTAFASMRRGRLVFGCPNKRCCAPRRREVLETWSWTVAASPACSGRGHEHAVHVATEWAEPSIWVREAHRHC